MSRVVSLRLDENDPDEAEALAILDRLTTEGHTVRTIVTQALLHAAGLQLAPRPDPHSALIGLEDVRQIITLAAQELATTVTASKAVIANDASALAETARETRAALAEAQQLITELQKVGTLATAAPTDQDEQKPISETLRASVRRAAKPGRRLE